MSSSDTNLPWVEKYRPDTLKDVVAQQEIVQTIENFIAKNRLPHLLFYGPPGTGKTSTVLAIAKQLYTKAEYGTMVLELNASNDRGIGVVRDEITTFASTKSMFHNSNKVKLVILDECDAMTKDAQNALRRVVEKFSLTTRFCFLCNYLQKIIPALQSRCTRFRYAPLSPQLMKSKLFHIAEKESVTLTEESCSILVKVSQGDLRKAINIMQSTFISFDNVDEESIYLCIGSPNGSDIERVMYWLLNETVEMAFKNISSFCQEHGFALLDIITQIHMFVHRLEIPPTTISFLVDKLANIEFLLSTGNDERVLTAAMVSAFMKAREQIAQTN